MDARELTRDEKKKIRSLVTGMCANYDRESGLCLPLDCACYMLHKCWTGAYCRYFREAVLPLDPELQAALTTEGISPELRACAVCGKAFLPEGRQAYCSDACKAEGNRRKSRERMRKMREKRPGGCYDLPPPKACVNSGKELTQGDCWLTIRSAKAQDGLWIYKLSTAHLCAY